jgi:hypothetical protein
MKLLEENKRLKRQMEELKARVQSQTIFPEKEHPTEEKRGLKRKAEQLEAKVQTPTIFLKKKHPNTSAQDSAGIFDAFFGAPSLIILSQALSSWLGLRPAVGFMIWLIWLAALFVWSGTSINPPGRSEARTRVSREKM